MLVFNSIMERTALYSEANIFSKLTMKLPLEAEVFKTVLN